MGAKQASVILVALLLCLPSFTHSFQPLFVFDGNTTTHRDITQRALLKKTAQVCQSCAAAEGRDFSLTVDDSLTAFTVQQACSSDGPTDILLSTVMFQTSIAKIYLSNAAVDVLLALNKEHHFDDESFQAGRDIITQGVSAIKGSVKRENFLGGRLILGLVCHTLQDFYSHSNWVELGNSAPYSALVKPDQALENLAGQDTPTCRNCTGESCKDNLLPMQQGLLTSGYFNLFSSTKPAGKCSHGGTFDQTSRQDPIGGINKDTISSSHGYLHNTAANLAVDATMELLEDIRVAVGDKSFLRLMGLSQASVLCFVIDTTGSMSDDIDEAKRVSFDIIDRKKGTPQEPSAYILVPFNDPEFGPVIVTTDSDLFKARINELKASGGGDLPEMCLSGLQLALTAAPPSSEIFVFTDAAAKDEHLKSAVTALIESTKTSVTFMLTDVLSSRRRRRTLQRGAAPRSMSQTDANLYRDLARASGGQAIEVTKSALTQATSVIEDSSAGAVVTVFQAVRNPGKPDSFTFEVDGSMRNITAYITGASSLTFSLTSPTGVSQASTESSGPLGSFTTVGNLRRFRVSADNITGSWNISVNSSDRYSLKVIGQSSVNFIYNLVEAHEGAHGDFGLKEGRPLTGGNASLLVTVTGSDTAEVREVSLVGESGSQVNGSVQSLGGGNFLVKFSALPAGEFVLRLKGGESATSRSTTPSGSFQRQASTQMKTSSTSVTVQTNSTTVKPGSTISIPFTVSTTTNGVVNATGSGSFAMRISNDRSYASVSPATISTAGGGQANGTVALTVPADAVSGSDVTLIVEAENTATADSNYAMLRLSVVAEVTDITRPVCTKASVSAAACPSSASLCSTTQWEFSANITDGVNGTGIESLTVRQGNGTLNTSKFVGAEGENVTLATYAASCCSQNVELVAVDGAGNVGTCVVQARSNETSTTAPETITPAAVVATTSTGGHTLTLSECLWISLVVSFVWM